MKARHTKRRTLLLGAALVAIGGAAVGGCGSAEEDEADVLQASTLNGSGAPGLILTFDDGPRNYAAPVTYTSIIDQSKSTVGSSADFAEWLQKKGVKATFFMVGSVVAAGDGLAQVKRIAAAGHTIASHTWGHITAPSFGRLALEKQESEIAKTDEILFRQSGFSRNLVTNADGKEVVFLRTPGGAWDKLDAPALNAKHGKRYVGPINWDIGGDAPAADWSCWSQKKTVEQCTALYRNDIAKHGGKGIILMHDIYAKSALVAMRLIEEHQSAGGKFCSLADAPRVKTTMDSTLGFSERFSLPDGRGGDSIAPADDD